MKNKLFYFISILMITSCTHKKSIKENLSEKDTLKGFKPNESVIAFKFTESLTDEQILKITGDDFVILQSKKFNPKTDTIKYTKNEIYISYLDALTGCVEYGGDIIIKNDSLILNLIPLNDIACTEMTVDRMIYRIKNPKNIRYKIGKH